MASIPETPTTDNFDAEDTAARLIALAAESLQDPDNPNQELVSLIGGVVSEIAVHCEAQEIADLIVVLVEISATLILEEEKNGNQG